MSDLCKNKINTSMLSFRMNLLVHPWMRRNCNLTIIWQSKSILLCDGGSLFCFLSLDLQFFMNFFIFILFFDVVSILLFVVKKTLKEKCFTSRRAFEFNKSCVSHVSVSLNISFRKNFFSCAFRNL